MSWNDIVRVLVVEVLGEYNASLLVNCSRMGVAEANHDIEEWWSKWTRDGTRCNGRGDLDMWERLLKDGFSDGLDCIYLSAGILRVRTAQHLYKGDVSRKAVHITELSLVLVVVQAEGVNLRLVIAFLWTRNDLGSVWVDGGSGMGGGWCIVCSAAEAWDVEVLRIHILRAFQALEGVGVRAEYFCSI